MKAKKVTIDLECRYDDEDTYLIDNYLDTIIESKLVEVLNKERHRIISIRIEDRGATFPKRILSEEEIERLAAREAYRLSEDISDRKIQKTLYELAKKCIIYGARKIMEKQ